MSRNSAGGTAAFQHQPGQQQSAMSTNGSEPLNWRNKRETEVELAQKYGIDPVPDKNRMPKSGEKNEVAGRKSPDDYVSFRPKNTDDKENENLCLCVTQNQRMLEDE